MVSAAALPGATLATYQALEQRARSLAPGWDIRLAPPMTPLPSIRFASGLDTLDEKTRAAVLVSAWAAQRWNVPRLAVPGYAATSKPRPRLAERRGLAIAELLQANDVAPIPAPAQGQVISLSLSPAN